MLTFGIIVAILTILAIAFVVPSLWSRKEKSGAAEKDNNSINVAIYKERMAELAEENLTPEQQAQAQQELDKTLVQDLEEKTKPITQPRARWASVIVAIAIPALAMGWYWKLGSWHLLMPAPPEPQVAHQQNGTAPDVDEMINNLVARLQENPDNEKGWRMLIRSYTYLERYAEAVQAYSKLLPLVDEKDPQLLSDYAQAIVLSNEGLFTERAIILLKSALEIKPDYQQALWLLGLSLYQKKDYKAAIDSWQRLLQQAPPPKVKAMLEKRIAKARHQLEQGDVAPNE